jgi:hypothetical protein
MAHGDPAMGGNMLNTVAMESNKTNTALQGGGTRGSLATEPPARFRISEVDDIRSYMFENIEMREIIHVDRLADDIARAIEKLAEMAVAQKKAAWVWIGDDRVTLKLKEHWKVKIMKHDSAVILLAVDRDGYYTPIAKAKEITWDGTEELFMPADIAKLAKEVARRVLEQARWL